MKKRVTMAAVMVLMLAGFSSGAQEEGEDAERLPEVVVSSTRTEKPADEAAMSITVISGEEIKSDGEVTLEEALREVPGVDIVRTGGLGGEASIFIRGGRGEHTLVMVDGVEIHDPMSTSRAARSSLISLSGVERVEVIRGPASPLYGSDALAGVVHIITKRGEGPPGVGLSLEGGSFNTYKESGEVFGEKGIFSWYASVSNLDTDGISSADKENDNDEADAFHLQSGEVKLGIEPAEWIALETSFRGYNSKTELDAFNYIDGLPEDDPDFYTENSFYFGSIGMNIFMLGGRWRQRVLLAQSNHSRDMEDEKDEDHPDDAFNAEYTGVSSQMKWQNDLELHQAHRLTLGMDYREESGEYKSDGESMYGEYEDDFDEETSIIQSAFIQWDFHRPEAGLIFGARSDHHDTFGNYITYRLAGTYLFNATGTRIKGSWGTGFRAPSIYQLYYEFIPGAPRPSGDLEPEESDSWEIGLVQSFFENRLSISATYFDAFYTDMIDWDPVSWTYINISEATSRGYELGLEFMPLNTLSLSASYSYVDAKDRETHDPLIRRSGEKYSAAVSWSPTRKTMFNLSALHVGERDDLSFAMGEEERVELDPYTLVNADFRYKLLKDLSLSLRVDNLLDEEYQEAYGYGMMPLTVYGGIHYNWRSGSGD